MRLKIYTRTGDSGKTSLYKGLRVFKNDTRVNAYGSLDELNSLLGVILSNLKDEKAADFINLIQEDLFSVGASLAGAKTNLSVLETRVNEMEEMIDWLDAKLPELKNFILPGGTREAVLLFYARAVARRCERELVALNQKDSIDKKILIYINRLSDLLFELARYLNFKAGIKETVWKNK